ncbi:MAG: Asp-tRNA(Asn)/Glu-tRNA(Gln) amidotransferase subunit GatC [Planctomycetota bacterium]
MMDIDRIAELARLDLSPDERARYGRELEGILAHFERLQSLETVDGASAFHLEAIERDDEPVDSPPRDELLRGAPSHDGEHYEVPRVIASE